MKKYKKIPSFWWDFDNENHVIIETDHPDYSVLAKFPYQDHDASLAIKQAENIIADLNAGRVSIKKIYKKFLGSK